MYVGPSTLVGSRFLNDFYFRVTVFIGECNHVAGGLEFYFDLLRI